MISLTPFIKSFSVNFTPSEEYDVSYYKVYAEPMSNFVDGDFIPSESNLINEGPETSFLHTVDKGGIWGVKIAAVDTFGDDVLNYSHLVTVSVPTLDPLDQIPPPVPTWLAAPSFPESGVDYTDVVPKTHIAVGWAMSEVPEDLVGFVVSYRQTGTNLWNEATLTSSIFRLETVISGVEYEFKVRSYDTWFNYSDWSTVKKVTAATDVIAPVTPVALVALGGIGCIKLTWSPYEDKDAKHTKIYRSITPSWASAVCIATIAGTSYVDSGLSTGTFYYYWVTTEDYSGNESATSPMAQAIPTTILAADLDISTRVDFVVKDAIFLFDHVDAPGTASTTLRWTAGTITRGSQTFTLAAGSLSNAASKYIIANLVGTTATLRTALFNEELTDSNDVIIASTSSTALAGTNNYACFVRQSNSMALEGALIREASITSAQIDKLSANKITAGTLDCSLVTLANLHFSDLNGSITWGSISNAPTTISQINSAEGNKLTYIGSTGIYSGTISANKLTAGNLSGIGVGVGDEGSIVLDGARSAIAINHVTDGTEMITIGSVGYDALLYPNYGIHIRNREGALVFKVDNTGATIQNLTAGTIDANLITINNLVVGKNVVMGPDATINWGSITSIPKFKTSELLDDAGFLTPTWTNIQGRPNTTYIASNGIYTGTLIADQVMATNFVADSANIANAAIKTAHIDDLSSTTYVPGSVGWKILKNGNAEFNNVTVRGALHATTFSADSAVIKAAHIEEASIDTLHIVEGAVTYVRGATFTPNFYNGVISNGNPSGLVAYLDIDIYTPGYYTVFMDFTKVGNLAYGTEDYLGGVQKLSNSAWTGFLVYRSRTGGLLDGAESYQATMYLSPPYVIDPNTGMSVYASSGSTHRIALYANTYWDANAAGQHFINQVSFSIFGGKR